LKEKIENIFKYFNHLEFANKDIRIPKTR